MKTETETETVSKCGGIFIKFDICVKETLTQNFCIRKLPQEYSTIKGEPMGSSRNVTGISDFVII